MGRHRLHLRRWPRFRHPRNRAARAAFRPVVPAAARSNGSFLLRQLGHARSLHDKVQLPVALPTRALRCLVAIHGAVLRRASVRERDAYPEFACRVATALHLFRSRCVACSIRDGFPAQCDIVRVAQLRVNARIRRHVDVQNRKHGALKLSNIFY